MIPARAVVLIALLAACGCDGHYGTYLIIGTPEDGDGPAIRFDRVELYFGDPIHEAVAIPLTPTLTAQGNKRLSGRLMRRQFVPSDRPDRLPALTTEWTYYIPPGDPNDRLGNYVLVLAFAGDQPEPVGVGEWFGFMVASDRAIHKYYVPLVPPEPGTVEQWSDDGAGACALWTRDRGADMPQTVAVVREGDIDCDGLKDRGDDVVDCDPLQ